MTGALSHAACSLNPYNFCGCRMGKRQLSGLLILQIDANFSGAKPTG
jgi:hypothetical protein